MNFIRWFLLVSLVILCDAQAQTTPADIFNFPELDFVTPEAAIEHFVESIAKNDAVAALQAFAVNEYAEKFDFTSMSQWLGAIDPYKGLAPSDYTMYEQLNRMNLIGRYAQQIKLFSYSFYISETLDGKIIGPVKEDLVRVRNFVSSVNPEQLANLKIAKGVRIIGTSRKLLDMLQRQAMPLGADEITELIILYELDGNYYLGGARLLLYEDSWKLDGLSSVLAATSILGDVTKTTPAEFEEFINELNSNENWNLEELTQ